MQTGGVSEAAPFNRWYVVCRLVLSEVIWELVFLSQRRWNDINCI